MQWGSIASSGLSALKAAAATAAEKAAKIQEEAEATLTGALNVDHTKPKEEGHENQEKALDSPASLHVKINSNAANSTSTDASAGDSQQQSQNLSILTRADLEELCSSRTQKLQQAIAKYRALHAEYKRVQRDYETLQGIIRDDEVNRTQGNTLNGTPDNGRDADTDVDKVRRELKETLKEKAMMQQMLLSKDQDIHDLQAELQKQRASAVDMEPRKTIDGSVESLAIKIEQLQRMLEQRDVDVAQAVAEVHTLHF
jgi:hypothetical protein